MKRIFKFLGIGLAMFVVAFVLASYFGQYLQGDEGVYTYTGSITSLSYHKTEVADYTLIEIEKPAVFCDQQKKCDENIRTGYAVENVNPEDLRLGQEVSVVCTVVPFTWIPSLDTDRVSCEVVK